MRSFFLQEGVRRDEARLSESSGGRPAEEVGEIKTKARWGETLEVQAAVLHSDGALLSLEPKSWVCWANVVRLRRTQDELRASAIKDGGDGVGPPAAGRLPEEGETPVHTLCFSLSFFLMVRQQRCCCPDAVLVDLTWTELFSCVPASSFDAPQSSLENSYRRL